MPTREKSNISSEFFAESPGLTSLSESLTSISESTAKKVASVNIAGLKGPEFNISGG